MSKPFTIFYYALAVFAFGFGGMLLILQTDLLPGYEVRIVQSGSMEPAIRTGSVVVIQEREQYQVGEIITFGDGSFNTLPTTHRITGDIVSGGELAYTTKGDANESADLEPVRLSDIRGAVVLTIPYLGYLLDFARQPLGFALLIGVPALLIVFEEVSSIYATIRGRKEDDVSDARSDDTPSQTL